MEDDEVFQHSPSEFYYTDENFDETSIELGWRGRRWSDKGNGEGSGGLVGREGERE